MSVKKYYLMIGITDEPHAGSKAKKDVEKILSQEGFTKIDLLGFSKASKMGKVASIINNVARYVVANRKYDNILVFAQSIPSFVISRKIFMILSVLLKVLFKNKPKILLIHDLESLRSPDKTILDRERRLLSLFTHVIFHSLEMQNYAKEVLGYTGKSYLLGFFDYLISKFNYRKYEENDLYSKRCYEIAFAGNLSPVKSRFLYDLIRIRPFNYRINLYGINWMGSDSVWIKYRGVFTPEELPSKIEADFGLVWDGNSIFKLDGAIGNYLIYNSPHKASLYLASGLPLIVPKKSAIYKLVLENNIGFGVDNLLEIDDILSNLRKDQYLEWKRNAVKIGEKLIKGHSLRNVLKLILKDIELKEGVVDEKF